MAQLTFRIFIPGRLNSKRDGALFWDLFLRHFPRHVPAGLGHGPNPTTAFDPNNLEPTLKKWNARNLYFQGQPPMSLSGQVLRPRPRLDYILHTQIFVYAFEDDPVAVRSFVHEISNHFKADYATAHILTRDYMRHRLRRLRPRGDRFHVVLPRLGKEFDVDLKQFDERIEKSLQSWPKRTVLEPEIGGIDIRRRYIDDLYWLNVFGQPYVEFFGRDRLLATPAYDVQELSYGGISIQLRPEIEDTSDSWNSFLAIQTRANAHLDKNAFFDPTLPRTHLYDGPKFAPINLPNRGPKRSKA